MSAPDLSHISIVLVEPEEPGNIGSTARAMNTMGLSRLVLVNPVPFDVGEARKMAHGSQDLLENAVVCAYLQEALADVALVVGTTHKRREDRPLLYPPAEAARRLVSLPPGQRGALVFGRESRGLSNEELRLCSMVSRIPAATKHPSLNLAQAVLIFSYEIAQAGRGGIPSPKLDLASFEELEEMYGHIQQTLDVLGFVSRNAHGSFMRSVRRVLGRVQLERRDAAALHKMCRAVDKFIARHRIDTE
jgi:TrmH family RNA methyltransferase